MENINYSVLDKIIKKYKENFDNYRKDEIYKWEAIKHFQENWNWKAKDFSKMLKEAFGKSANLLRARNYFAEGMIVSMAKRENDTVKKMFEVLFDEKRDIVERCNSFIEKSNELQDKYWKGKHHYQDAHSISVYLTFMYPEKYYLYKPNVYKGVSKLLEIENNNSDKIQTLNEFFKVSNEVCAYIKGDKELIEISKKSLNVDCYKDDKLHILTTDIFYYAANWYVEKRYWMYAPGENARLWEDNLENGIMALGWDETGDLNQYKDDKEILNILKKMYKKDNPMNDKCALDDFKNTMDIGDIIIVKKGATKLLGYGEVISKYYYDDSRKEYKHVRKVKWIKKGEWNVKDIEGEKQVAQKTLTDITRYDKYYKKFLDLMNEDIFMDNNETIINKLAKFYRENLINNDDIEKEIENRNKFLNEYPLKKILELTKEEYCLGLENSHNSFCHKLEFGEYKNTGFSIGGASSGKCGFYYGDDGNFKGKNDKVIDDVDNYWNEFKNQLYNFLVEMANAEPNFILDEKYPLLGGKGNYMFLTKLLCLYYPDRFTSMSKEEVYEKLGEYFGEKYNKKAIYNSYYSNQTFRRLIPEANEHDGFYIADAIWKFVYDNSDLTSDHESKRVEGGDNKIIYGVPGTGKSFWIKNRLDEKGISKENIFRVTFHPEFTYNDFVGQLLPKVNKETKEITYDFSKGEFTKALIRAYDNPSEEVYLVIEEMSRGNCAAIFGDIFQLLDRYQDGEEKDWSIYEVKNELIASKIDSRYVQGDSIRIPSNMFIWGTVNTSDQNVYVMDNAFKRRFEWQYVSTAPKENLNNESIEIYEFKDTKFEVKWVNLYQKLNEYISSNRYLDLGEDKQIGQFFIMFTDNDEQNQVKIRDKLLHYLWFDVQNASYKNECKLFDSDISNFSTLYDSFNNHERIFSDEFIEALKK